MSSFVKDKPTSIISNYRKVFSREQESLQDIFNPSQQRLGDSSDSIKRYLEKLLENFPPLGGYLIKEYHYDTPGEIALLSHELRRPYVGLDVISVKSPPPFRAYAFKNSNQAITSGTVASVDWNSSATSDPFSAISGSVITPPFNCICDISVQLERDYNGGAVSPSVADYFYFRDSGSGSRIGPAQAITRQTATTTLLWNSATLNSFSATLSSSSTYDVRYEAACFNLVLLNTATGVSSLQITENKTAMPRISEEYSDSQPTELKSIKVPIVCDKACIFWAVVY